MDSYDRICDKICRLCLSYYQNEDMVSLTCKMNNISHYGKAVKTFANISIQDNDNLPKNMCIRCLFLLKQTIAFKFKCESSDRQLKNLTKCVNIDSIENLKENIVQYSMFRSYFPVEVDESCGNNLANNKLSNFIQRTRENKDNLLHISMNKVNCSIKNTEKLQSQTELSNNTLDTGDKGDLIGKQKSAEEETNINHKQSDEQILDVLEAMIGSHSEILNSDFGHCRKRKLLKKRKLKGKQKTIQKHNLKNHMSNLVCKVCHKVLANQHTYKHHMQRHNGCRYICEICGKGFPVSTELNIHRVARHGTGAYLQCQHCPFKAPRKFDLIEHERIHTGERPYTCDKCGLTFRRRGIWRKHLIYHMEKKVQCPQCPRKFYQRGEMLAHANNVHERIYVYLCSKCGVTYARPATVRRHLTERHNIPRELQGKVIRVNKASTCHKNSV